MTRPSPEHCCLKLLLLLALGGATMHVPDADVVLSSLGALRLDGGGHFTFHDAGAAARDFGNRCSLLPAAVLHPGSVSDVAATVRHVFSLGGRSPLTVAARGHGHSLMGQSQAAGGIVVRMESLRLRGDGGRLQVHHHHAAGGGAGVSPPFVDAPGGELWINVLRETLKYGLAPKSWTDYLHLTVGGTLSNAGVSGQAFRHGPQVSNVNQLEIVTGLKPTRALITIQTIPTMKQYVADRFLPCQMQEEEMLLPARPMRTLISSTAPLAVSVSSGSSPERGLPSSLLPRW